MTQFDFWTKAHQGAFHGLTPQACALSGNLSMEMYFTLEALQADAFTALAVMGGQSGGSVVERDDYDDYDESEVAP